MSEEKIFVETPTPHKKGLYIDKKKYELMKKAILTVLQQHSEVRFVDLTSLVSKVLDKSFEGAITWYVTTVKLDLEVKGIIERIPGSKPQRLRLK